MVKYLFVLSDIDSGPRSRAFPGKFNINQVATIRYNWILWNYNQRKKCQFSLFVALSFFAPNI